MLEAGFFDTPLQHLCFLDMTTNLLTLTWLDRAQQLNLNRGKMANSSIHQGFRKWKSFGNGTRVNTLQGPNISHLRNIIFKSAFKNGICDRSDERVSVFAGNFTL